MLRDAAGSVLLVRSAPLAPWRLPGGPVRAGENAEAALARTLDEDCGLSTEGPFRMFAIYAKHGAKTTAQVVLFIVPTWALPQKGACAAGERLVNLFSPDKLPEGTEPATVKRIGDVIARRQASELW